MKNYINYPRFIPHTPCKKDLLKCEPHEKLANTITEHIKDDHSELSHVIGIDGAWGSGKSNVIELVKTKLEAQQCQFYIFDLWQYQDDLNSKFFLQKLISSLTKNNKLDAAAFFNEKVEKLHTEVKEKRVITESKFSCILIYFILLFLFLSSVTSFVLELAKIELFSKYQDGIYIGFAVLIIASVILFCCFKTVNDFLSIVVLRKSPEVTETTSTKTTLSTIYDIQKILACLSKKLNGKQLIIALDNMDRIQNNAVDKIWNLLHALTCDDCKQPEGRLYKPWFIVPFDRNKIKCDTDKDEFLEKIFPVIYRLPEPILADYREVFEYYSTEAFGSRIERAQINIIRLYFNEVYSNVSIRTIITFINKIVSVMRSRSNDEISIKSMAIYQICKSVIELDPVEKLLFGSYLSEVCESNENCKEKEKSRVDPANDQTQKDIEEKATMEDDVDKVRDNEAKETMLKFDPSCEKRGLARLIQPFEEDEIKVQVAALHYGVTVQDAKQIFLFDSIKLELRDIVYNGVKYSSNKYLNNRYSVSHIERGGYSNISLLNALIAYIDVLKGIDIDKFIYFADDLLKKDQTKCIDKRQEFWAKLCDKRLSLPIFYHYAKDMTNLLLQNLRNDTNSRVKLLAKIVNTEDSIDRRKDGWSVLCYTVNAKLAALHESKIIEQDQTFKIDIEREFEIFQYVAAAQKDYVKYLRDESFVIYFARRILNPPKHLRNQGEDYFSIATLSAIALFSREDSNVLEELRDGVFQFLSTKCLSEDKISSTFICYLQIYKYFSQRLGTDFNKVFAVLRDRKISDIKFFIKTIVQGSESIINDAKFGVNKVNPYFVAMEFARRRRWLLSLIDLACVCLLRDEQIEFLSKEMPYFESINKCCEENSILDYIRLINTHILNEDTRIFDISLASEAYFIKALTPLVDDIDEFLNKEFGNNIELIIKLREYLNSSDELNALDSMLYLAAKK